MPPKLLRNFGWLVCVSWVLLWPGAGQAHRLNAGLSVIEYSRDGDEIQVTHRLYSHDFEKLIRKEFGRGWEYNQQTRDFIGAYCSKRFALALDGQLQDLAYVGSETEAEFVYIYFTAPSPGISKKAIIWNVLLFDAFPAQVNLVNFNIAKKTYSATLSASKTTETIVLAAR
ncbi:Translation elongation factor G [hydrothermal vent metagenome]|uniref:Translation elongation factor G n=1 Tax=hydrothermal vent metagenome TaxID=652676 RepID=A0A3B0T4N7_9ZZZZ